jgi:hypothetical protein
VRIATARAIAERAYGDQVDAGGAPIIDHVRRVARTTPRRSRGLAWLHEVLEWTTVSEQSLLADGLTDDELRALRLLTRLPGEHTEAGYLRHLELLAHTGGPAGTLAREVKRADLEDRVVHRAFRPDGWAPPYERGLAILES